MHLLQHLVTAAASGGTIAHQILVSAIQGDVFVMMGFVHHQGGDTQLVVAQPGGAFACLPVFLKVFYHLARSAF